MALSLPSLKSTSSQAFDTLRQAVEGYLMRTYGRRIRVVWGKDNGLSLDGKVMRVCKALFLNQTTLPQNFRRITSQDRRLENPTYLRSFAGWLKRHLNVEYDCDAPSDRASLQTVLLLASNPSLQSEALAYCISPEHPSDSFLPWFKAAGFCFTASLVIPHTETRILFSLAAIALGFFSALNIQAPASLASHSRFTLHHAAL